MCDKTRQVLQGAIQSAIHKWETEVSLTTKWYQIDEGWWYIKAFLEQEWYQNVLVEERWYTCFDNNRWQTQIVFSF